MNLSIIFHEREFCDTESIFSPEASECRMFLQWLGDGEAAGSIGILSKNGSRRFISCDRLRSKH